MQGKGREFYQLRRYHLNSGPQRNFAMIFPRCFRSGRLTAGHLPCRVFIFRLGRRHLRFMC